MAEPRNADALTHVQPFDASPDRIDPADDFVTRDDRHLRVGQFAIDDMQVRAADAAGGHLHSNLAGPGLPIGEFGPFQSSPKLVQHHRLHSVLRFHVTLALNVTRATTGTPLMASSRAIEAS